MSEIYSLSYPTKTITNFINHLSDCTNVIKTKNEGQEETLEWELEHSLKYKVISYPGGENLLNCIQCGACSSVCPVSEVNSSFDPRQNIKMIILGMLDELLKNDRIYLCSGCYSCYERCPQNVRITLVMLSLQQVLADEGRIHTAHTTAIENLASHGRLIEIDRFDNRMRKKLGLPVIQERNNEIRKILEITGLVKK